jgi:hypothetical protein
MTVAALVFRFFGLSGKEPAEPKAWKRGGFPLPPFLPLLLLLLLPLLRAKGVEGLGGIDEW